MALDIAREDNDWEHVKRSVDMFRVSRSTRKLLLAFLIGSVATTVGTVVAYWLVLMQPLGREGWKIVAALMGRHIGGAVNYAAIAETLQISPSVLAAGLAADNVICAVYFATLFALAAKIPPESAPLTTDVEEEVKSESGSKHSFLQSATALAVSFAICKLGSFVTKYYAVPGGSLPAITAIVVALATVFPKQFTHLAPADEVKALILMQIERLNVIIQEMEKEKEEEKERLNEIIAGLVIEKEKDKTEKEAINERMTNIEAMLKARF